jgi:hypothetical protein
MSDLKKPKLYHADPNHSVEKESFYAELGKRIDDLDYLLSN